MKKILFLCGAIMMMAASCTTTSMTSTTVDMPQSLLSSTVADLKVFNERVNYTMTPSKEIQRGGMSNVKQAAEAAALAEYTKKTGKSADILVEPEYVIHKSRILFWSKVESITVTGRPATYENFHSLNDSVWCNPVFRSNYTNDVNKRSGGITDLFK